MFFNVFYIMFVNHLLLCVIFKLISSTAVAGNLTKLLFYMDRKIVGVVGEIGIILWGVGHQKLTFTDNY